MMVTDRATEADAAQIAALHARAAVDLTARHGSGPWSIPAGENAVLRALRSSEVLVVRDGGAVVATVTLSERKPWAIDPAYFTPARMPLYLLSMAVDPARQRHGIGRSLLADAQGLAELSAADAFRLDAYDAAAGAGSFYARCGFREVGRKVYRGVPLVYFEAALPAHG
jgi:predicted N-acetyltransferase YhbS